MHECIISLAANYCAEKNLAEARERLCQILFEPLYTKELWTKPEGHKACSSAEELPLYLNQLVKATTNLELQQLQEALKQMEAVMGRTLADRNENRVRIDLDLLLFDNTRYHCEDWNRRYVKALITEL